MPDSGSSCGPYSPKTAGKEIVPSVSYVTSPASDFHHDTIGQIVMDKHGSFAVGLSSNGAQYKIPGYGTLKYVS